MHPARALLIVDHGSRSELANSLLESIAVMVRDRVDGWMVTAAHMELAEPDIAAGIAACVREGASEIVVVPYFLSPGRHAREDVPRIVGAEAARYPGVRVRVTDPLGPHGLLADLVLERAGLPSRPFSIWGEGDDGRPCRVEHASTLEDARAALRRLASTHPDRAHWLEREGQPREAARPSASQS